MTKSKNPQTLVLHGGAYRADPATGSVAVPIYQTTSYQFRGTEHAANLFALKELGNIYTRVMNPTCDVLEQRVAALAVSSGQAATAIAIQNIAQAGDNIVSSTDLYGGTWNLFANTFKTMGIEVRFVDPVDPEAFRRATDDKTRAYYAETLPNPKLTVFPIEEVAAIGQKLGVPLIGLTVLAASAEAGLCLIEDRKRHAVFMFNHLEYDSGTLAEEFRRDRQSGKAIGIPRGYFPDDDPTRAPENSWRPYGHLLFANWLGEIDRTAWHGAANEVRARSAAPAPRVLRANATVVAARTARR